MHFSFFTYFTVSCNIPGPTVRVSHFACFSVFLAIFHVIPCEFLIFLVCQFLAIFQVLQSVCLIFYVFSFLAILQVLQCAFLIFHVFECFLPYSRSKSFYVSFFTFFQFSCHIPGTIVCISHFSRLSIFLAIFHFLQCVFLIFHDFQFSHLIPGPTVCISHFLAFSVVFAIFQVLQYVFLIFHDFQFLPYSGHTVCILCLIHI